MKKGKAVAFFVTGNIHKFHEARNILSKYHIAVAMLNLDTVEIQADNIKTIAKASASDAARKSGLPVLVEDAGLFIKALKGFPGSYSNYVYRTIGTKGILTLMETIRQRDAYFHSVISFCSPHKRKEPLCFEGRVNGRITYKERGKQGFGFDPIFEPQAGSGETFAQMTTDQKNNYSHRARALQKFAKWYRLHV